MNFEPIGVVSSPFREKFGIPRQPGLVPEAEAVVTLRDTPEMRQALRDLEGFSHVWVVFVFHEVLDEGWNALVRPPRLGGARKVGVFASRSPHRPNPIGISAVRLERVEGNRVFLRGADLLDGTPVLDLKPYVPYTDAIADARAGWLEEAGGGQEISRLGVEFSEEALRVLDEERGRHPRLRVLIEQVLSLDPRPAFQAGRGDPGTYAMKLAEFDVHWRVEGGVCQVTRIERLGITAS